MEKIINDKLIDALKANTPPDQNTVDMLIRLTGMSKEAAYRRLRGEIPLTLAEATAIVAKLRLSLDEMAGIDKKYNYMFHIKEFFNDDPFGAYYDLQSKSLAASLRAKDDPNAAVFFAGNILPPHFYFKYPNFSRFLFFRFFYQTQPGGMTRKLQDVQVPQRIVDIHQALYESALFVKTTFIIGDDLTLALVNDMKAFAATNTVTVEELEILKRDIGAMLDDMERTTVCSSFLQTGQQIQFYVANSYFDGNYCYLSSSNLATIYLYGLNQVHCKHETICRAQKEWIDSLIAHSTLISGSGKFFGARFFADQREILNQYDPSA